MLPFQKNVLLHEQTPPEHIKPIVESHIVIVSHVSFIVAYKTFLIY